MLDQVKKILSALKEQIRSDVLSSEFKTDQYVLQQTSTILNQLDRLQRMINTLNYYIRLNEVDKVIVVDVENKDVRLAYAAQDLAKIAIQMEELHNEDRNDEDISRAVQFARDPLSSKSINRYSELPALPHDHILTRVLTSKRRRESEEVD